MAVTESVTCVQRKFRATGDETPLPCKSIPWWLKQFEATGSKKEGRNPASSSALPWTKPTLRHPLYMMKLMALWGSSLTLHCRLLWTVPFITKYFYWRERFHHKSFWTPFEHFGWLCFCQLPHTCSLLLVSCHSQSNCWLTSVIPLMSLSLVHAQISAQLEQHAA